MSDIYTGQKTPLKCTQLIRLQPIPPPPTLATFTIVQEWKWTSLPVARFTFLQVWQREKKWADRIAIDIRSTHFFSRCQTCKKVRFHSIPVVVVVTTETMVPVQLTPIAVNLRLLISRFLASVYFRQSWKLHFWKLHEKSILLVEKNFFLLLFFSQPFFLNQDLYFD